MKNFPFRLLFVCMFLPPICYILTIHMLQGYLQKVEASSLNHVLVRNFEGLYEGRHCIQEEVRRNLAIHLRQSLKYSFGVRTQILVTTKIIISSTLLSLRNALRIQQNTLAYVKGLCRHSTIRN